jgi:hypothetical protein
MLMRQRYLVKFMVPMTIAIPRKVMDAHRLTKIYQFFISEINLLLNQ